jgi:autotransporter-associated beta strand protein
LSGAISLGGPTSIVAANPITLSGNITESVASSLSKSGASTLKLSGANTFSGGLTVSAGIVQAGDNAAFSMPFVNLGLCPEAGSSLLAVQLMGYQRAAEALLMGEPFMVETAMELGLISRVLPPAEVNAYAQSQAQKMARKPLSSLMETKRLMKSARTPSLLLQMDEEAVVFGRLLKEPAAVEAFSAFMEKRKPVFN